MAFTYGFYNSLDGDRRYNALQMSSLFDGIIRDGVFMSIGTQMMVKATGTFTVTVGLGRAWFDHTWSDNDAIMPIELDGAEVIQDRIDAVVLDIDHNEAARKNSIVVVKGSPSTAPQKPALIKSLYRNQYPLCYVTVRRGTTGVNQADIENRIGTSDMPFVTGILDTMNIDDLVAQWGDQWYQFYDMQTKHMVATTEGFIRNWDQFFTETSDDVRRTAENWKTIWNEWFENERSTMQLENAQWRDDRQRTFDDWFASLRAILEPDVAANLAAQILDLTSRMISVELFRDNLTNDFTILRSIDDYVDSAVTDSLGRPIDGRVVFVVR